MCGIAGILTVDDGGFDPESVATMVRSLRHRGPDELAMYAERSIGLGHARLSIIDPESGQQPMSNADGTLWLTFNGEIFNYVELRDELTARGHRFRTRSDTEVILNAYQEYGTDCVHRFNGQWAFGLWDASRRMLFLSRDRIGVRPLFYTKAGRSFFFASEIKALFCNREVQRSLDLRALDQLFTFWVPLTPRTMFDNIFEVPPGHSLTVGHGDVRQWCYWRPRYAPDADRPTEYYVSRLAELLLEATRIRLRADVPVGAYLSGGLDSTVTAALVKRLASSGLRTFSVTFDDPAFDESAFQRAAVAHLQADHTSVHCGAADIARVFPDVVWHAEKPLLRTAPAPLFLLSRMVREQGYKVVVTGEGADEMLGGYDIFKEAKVRRFLSRSPGSQWRAQLLRRLYPYMRDIQSQPPAYLEAFFDITSSACANPFFSHLPRWNLTARLKLFYSATTRATLTGYDPLDDIARLLPADYERWDDLARAQYLETAHLLPGYILSSQGDRMAMAHAVEGRFPFLDHRVVEFAATMPARVKMRALQEKYVLRHAFGALVPSSIASRRKQPYRAPDAASFTRPSGDACPYVEELLSPGALRESGVFDPAAVGRLVTKVRSAPVLGVKDNMAFVGILSTQLLIRQFLRASAHGDDSKCRAPVRRRELPVRPGGHPARERRVVP